MPKGLRAITVTVGLLIQTALFAVPARAAAGDVPAAADFPAVTLNQVTSAAGFVHPGIGVSAGNLLQARQQVLAGVEPWASYYAAMVATPYASTTFSSANAGSQVDRPGTDAFNSQGVEAKFIDDAFRAYTQSILYVITGNPAYRENGMRLIRIWSHMDPAKYAYYADAHIHSGVPLLRMLAAAEILRYSGVNPGTSGYDLAWADADTANLTTNLVRPIRATFNSSNTRFMNQHLYGLVGSLAGYIFTDDQAGYRQGVEWFSVNSTDPDAYANGGLTSLIRRIDAKDPLNPYGHAFVQHQEMGRDQAHGWDGIAKLSEIARLLTIQGTRLDPRSGTVSTRRNAVSPYRFAGDRLLAGADAFYGYMMGKSIPWIDTSDHGGVLSEAYRGRVFEPIDELYDVYRYDLGVDVEREAPNVAAMARQADGPVFYWGTGSYNFWNSNPDYNVDYWLSLPAAVAGKARPAPGTALVQAESRSIPLDRHSSVRREDDRTFVRMRGPRSTIAMRTLMYDSVTGYSPVGVLIRTNGPATLQIRKDTTLAPYHTVALPDTHGQWRYVVYDMDAGLLPGSTGGAYLAYYTVAAAPSVAVDVDSVNLQAKTQLTPPVFALRQQATLIAVAGSGVSRSLAATNAIGYEASGLPAGAALDATSGLLTWAPTARDVGDHRVAVVATDGTVDTVLTVTVKVVADRAAAITAALAGDDPGQAYASASLAAVTAALAAASAASSDAATFDGAIVGLQDAVARLQPLSPRLADGTLDYRGTATSPTLTSYAIAGMADGDFNSTSGDLRAPFVLDFGAGFRVRADAFGLQARWNFANRSEGANVYGSNDGTTWTLLTSRETTNTTEQKFAMETIPVRPEVAGKTFRYLKVQVDDPGVPTDPAYPGLSSFSELRIQGDRLETVQAVSAVTLSSTDPTPGRAVNGDTVTVDVVATQPLTEVSGIIEGVPATVDGSGTHWRLSAVLPETIGYGRTLRFGIDYKTTAGDVGSTVTQTTDGSGLALWNTHIALAAPQASWVTASTVSWDGKATAAVNGWRMLDGDPATYTDTKTANGWVTVTPPSGTTLDFNAVRVLPRSAQASRANGTVVQESTDGGTTWQTLATITGVTTDASWYLFPLTQDVSAPMLRILDEHGGFTNLAEVQLLHFDGAPF